MADEWGLLRRVTLDGLGIAMSIIHLVQRHFDAGILEGVLPEYGLRRGLFYALVPSRDHRSPKVRVFLDSVADKLRPGLADVDVSR